MVEYHDVMWVRRSHVTNTFMFISAMGDINDPTHYSIRVGQEVAGVVAVLCGVGWVEKGYRDTVFVVMPD